MSIKLVVKDRMVMIGVIAFLMTRLWSLGGLPIFNDEAIYLDWGKIMVTTPLSFYSLYDGKQPMLMWVFGLNGLLFDDPLIAGRLVSVAMGFISLMGIYKIGGLYSKQVQLVACSWYVLNPLMVFFDRQALMESAVGAVGVWSFYVYLRFLKSSKMVWPMMLALIWCVGLWIKSTSVLFVASTLLLVVTSVKRGKLEKVGLFGFSLVLVLIGLLPLAVQPGFSNVWKMNDRFALGVSEIVGMPFGLWGGRLRFMIEVGVVQVLGVTSLIVMNRLWQGRWKLVDIWILLGFLLFAVSVRENNLRYLIPLLPLVGISLGLSVDWKKWWHVGSVVVSLVWFGGLSLGLIYEPIVYFKMLDRLTVYSQSEVYTGGFTSGYGVSEAIEYVNKKAEAGELVILTRLDAGNPESAVRLYFGDRDDVALNAVGIRPEDASDIPIFVRSGSNVIFVSREEHLAGHNAFFELERAFYKPDGASYVGVWKLKEDFKIGDSELF